MLISYWQKERTFELSYKLASAWNICLKNLVLAGKLSIQGQGKNIAIKLSSRSSCAIKIMANVYTIHYPCDSLLFCDVSMAKDYDFIMVPNSP